MPETRPGLAEVDQEMKIHFHRGSGLTIKPHGEDDLDAWLKLHLETLYVADVKKISPHNYKFHCKYMSLVRLGFDYWEPTVDGELAQKDFDHYRRWLTKQAGFFKTVVNVDGTIENIAESIRYEKMSDEEKSNLYNRTIDALMDTVLKDCPFDWQNERFNQILSYV